VSNVEAFYLSRYYKQRFILLQIDIEEKKTMANIRIFALLLILLIIVNCVLIEARSVDEIIHRDKRFDSTLKLNLYFRN
jgi:hypothetical protein